jgi:hypothetical protein
MTWDEAGRALAASDRQAVADMGYGFVKEGGRTLRSAQLMSNPFMFAANMFGVDPASIMLDGRENPLDAAPRSASEQVGGYVFFAGTFVFAPEAALAKLGAPVAKSLTGFLAAEKWAAAEARAANSVERGLGSTAGHGTAAEVLPGGSGQAFAGHGVMVGEDALLGRGYFTAPDGTTVVMPRPGIGIADSTGRLLESLKSVGELEVVLRTGRSPSGDILTPRNLRDLNGYQVVKPGEGGYNYTLLHPGADDIPLTIYSNSSTTLQPVRLSELLEPDMGCVFWAACTLPKPFLAR